MRDESQSERRRGLPAIYAPIRIVGRVQKEWNLRGAATGAFCGFAAPVGEDGAGGKHGYSGQKRPQSMLLTERYKQKTLYISSDPEKRGLERRATIMKSKRAVARLRTASRVGFLVTFDSSKLELQLFVQVKPANWSRPDSKAIFAFVLATASRRLH